MKTENCGTEQAQSKKVIPDAHLPTINGGIQDSVKSLAEEIDKDPVNASILLETKIRTIKELTKSIAESSWRIGKELVDIQTTQLYRTKGFKSFNEFCMDDLPFSRATAYIFLRIFKYFTEEDAKKLGNKKCELLLRAPNGSFDDLKKLSMPSEDGRSDYSVRNLKDEIQRRKNGGVRLEPSSNQSILKYLCGYRYSGTFSDGVAVVRVGKVSIKVKVESTTASLEFVSVESTSPQQISARAYKKVHAMSDTTID